MQSVGRSSAKLVLLSLADRADESHTAFPSITRLASDTGLDRKTVMSATNHLLMMGLVVAEKTRGGRTIYRLIGVPGREHAEPKPVPKTGPVPKTVPVPKTGPDQSQKRDRYQYQKRDTNLPSNQPRTEKRAAAPREYPVPTGVDPRAWADYQEHRKTNKPKDWTSLAAKKVGDKLAKYSPRDQREMVDKTIASGWTGVFPPDNEKGYSKPKGSLTDKMW
jgi:hypothetical protein